ncbi:MAG: heavy metal translocating P-type ATPase [Burkholderiales bacterium PBB5]|nr:MAG: heavy metal translocating P-type ATPase [Burkholderiales bacterium PBB5]
MTTHPPAPLLMPALPAADDLRVLDDPVELQRFTRFSADASGTRTADSALRISGMHCAACAGLIEQAVARVDGVLEATVSAAGERARIRWNPQRTRMADIVAAIHHAGYGATPDAAVEAREARKLEHRQAVWRLFVAAFCAMQVMMMATPSYVAHGDELAPDLRQLLNWGSWLLTLPVLAFAAGPFFSGAWRSLKARRIGMDVPVALGIVVTFVASSGATFDPQGLFGREVYFDSLTMFVSFLLAGRLLETRARHRVAQVLEAALDGMPHGDRGRGPVGQAFPGDGVRVEGATRADESLLTGESVPVAKACGAAVVGGSLNLGAPVVVQLQRVGADTRLEGIVALMRDAMTQRPSLARAADRWAAPFLWLVLLLAAGAAAVWSVIDPSRAVWVAVAVLIVTCPCALSLAAPSAMLAAASALARRGVLLQRLDALEAITRVQRIYLDKTGTVTDEHLQLQGLQRLAPCALDDDALRARAASLAAWSSHPLSQALVAACPAGAHVWHEVAERPGQGLMARDDAGRVWRLGAAGFVQPDIAADLQADGPSVWLGCDGLAWAVFRFDEALRPDARSTVDALRASGLQVVLLSGDRPERAARMAERLAVDAVIGGATPERKLAEVAAAQASGLVVAMVGDGLNDAPVLARADVSLAMGQGALVARAQADATLVGSRLADVLQLRLVALRTMRVVRQNISWAVAYNLVCIPLAVTGWLPPWAAGLGMAGSSLLVIGNALRLAR